MNRKILTIASIVLAIDQITKVAASIFLNIKLEIITQYKLGKIFLLHKFTE